jgi:hypothetical protein
MEEFKQVGRYGLAIGLWLGIIWLFSKPKRILLLALTLIITFFGFALLFDDTGDLYYVNVDRLELLDKPFGNQSKVLVMNDTLRMVGKLNDNWFKVAIGTDTLYFQNKYTRHYHFDVLGDWAVIQRNPFTIYTALKGQEVKLNHPDGYIEVGLDDMYKNGDLLHVLWYKPYNNSIVIKTNGGRNHDINVEYIDTDWERIKRQYPLAQEIANE